jgi:hypothetical protein
MNEKEISLREHLESIAAKGGQARAEKLSSARKTAIARKGGKAGGKARAAKLSAIERKEIAKKAIAARWAKARLAGGRGRKKQAEKQAV